MPAAGGKPRQLTNGKHNLGRLVAVHGDRASPSRSSDSTAAAKSGRWTRATPRRRESRTCSTTSRATSSSDARKRFTWKGADGVTVEGIAHLSGRLPGRAEVSAGGA